MRVLSLDGDENIWAFMAVFFKRFKDPELGSTRKVHHEWVGDLAMFVPMTRCCGTILVTTKDLRDLNSRQHTRCTEK